MDDYVGYYEALVIQWKQLTRSSELFCPEIINLLWDVNEKQFY
jgi:hypothetical protein